MIKIIIKITGLFINFTKPDRKLYILEQRFTICPKTSEGTTQGTTPIFVSFF